MIENMGTCDRYRKYNKIDCDRENMLYLFTNFLLSITLICKSGTALGRITKDKKIKKRFAVTFLGTRDKSPLVFTHNALLLLITVF